MGTKKFKGLNRFKDKQFYAGLLIIATVVLLLIGLYMIYSASYVNVSNGVPSWSFVEKQFISIVLGAILFMLGFKFSKTPIKFQKFLSVILLIISTLLVIYSFFFGTSVNGSSRWIDIGFMSFQPSEFLKVFFIFFVAGVLDNLSRKKKQLTLLLMVGFLIVPGIVALSNLSTSLIMIAALFAMYFIYGIKFYRGVTILGVLTIFGIYFSNAQSYRVARFGSFLSTLKDPLNASYQVKQGLYALANGGIFGQGLTNSIQKFYYLPEQHTDFILAIIGEELGFIFIIIIIILILVYVISTLQIGIKESKFYFKELLIGFGILFAAQAALNIGVVIALLPPTGVTLPFISYGGTSVMALMLMTGYIFGRGGLDNSKSKKNKSESNFKNEGRKTIE